MKKGGRNEGFILNYLGIPYFLRQFCEDILAEWAHLFRLPDSDPSQIFAAFWDKIKGGISKSVT